MRSAEGISKIERVGLVADVRHPACQRYVHSRAVEERPIRLHVGGCARVNTTALEIDDAVAAAAGELIQVTGCRSESRTIP
jgi:hypothetical protein